MAEGIGHLSGETVEYEYLCEQLPMPPGIIEYRHLPLGALRADISVKLHEKEWAALGKPTHVTVRVRPGKQVGRGPVA